MPTHATTPRPAFTVRPPVGAEARACRMLAPGAFRRGTPSRTWVAVASAPFRFLGAAACSATTWAGRPGWTLDVHVIPPERKRGVGAALFTGIGEFASLRPARRWLAWHDSADGTEAPQFLTKRGFQRLDRLTTFEAPVEQMVGLLRPIRERLLASGRVPANARLVDLAEAPAADVARLHAATVGGQVEALTASLHHDMARNATFTPTSRVLMVDGRVRGLALVAVEGDVARFESRVVDPALRGGWANVLLMALDLERGLSLGVRRVQFHSSAGNADTIKLAARCGARSVGFKDLYQRARPVEPI